MLDEKSLTNLESSLRRIFAMKLTRSTFRELQNTLIALANGNKDLTNDLYESLFTAQPKDSVVRDPKLVSQFKDLCRNFSVLVRLSKEIFERGEFVNIITSDTIIQGKDISF